MYNLSPTAFMLWIYFADNKNGYQLDLYPIHFIEVTGLSRSTYDRNFKELLDKGYLVQSKKNKNYYMFKEVSETIPLPDVISSLEEESFENVLKEYFE